MYSYSEKNAGLFKHACNGDLHRADVFVAIEYRYKLYVEDVVRVGADNLLSETYSSC